MTTIIVCLAIGFLVGFVIGLEYNDNNNYPDVI